MRKFWMIMVLGFLLVGCQSREEIIEANRQKTIVIYNDFYKEDVGEFHLSLIFEANMAIIKMTGKKLQLTSSEPALESHMVKQKLDEVVMTNWIASEKMVPHLKGKLDVYYIQVWLCNDDGLIFNKSRIRGL